jgi:membrane-associated phospholipid phosphatase
MMAASLAVLSLCGSARGQGRISNSHRVEPFAGEWKTWIISSGQAYRVPPPPDAAETRAELYTVRRAVSKLDADGLEKVKHWDAGSSAYRWIEMIERRIAAGEPLTAHPHRPLAYVAMAIYDATVAAWESKYQYRRLRPSEMDPSIRPVVAVPESPSYPSEHAAAAAAAAAVLAHFLPGEAASLQAMAETAANSRLQAGVQFPSDIAAGMELGRKVAQAVIARASSDGYTTAWSGAVPSGRCMWTGTNPGNAAAPGWKPVLLGWPGEFRSPAPPDCESPQMKSEVATVKTFSRTFNTNMKAYWWQGPEGRETWNLSFASKWMFEDGLQQNPPRAARVYALLAAAHYDAFIASQDGKFAYWYVRPHQLDPAIAPLFAVPNFPSYPSNHSTFSWSRAEVLAYLFPGRAATARAMAQEAADSRVWAGIHYPVDLAAGKTLGGDVARKFIAWAEKDGSQ